MQLRLDPIPGLAALMVVHKGPPLPHVLHKEHKVAPVLRAEECSFMRRKVNDDMGSLAATPSSCRRDFLTICNRRSSSKHRTDPMRTLQCAPGSSRGPCSRGEARQVLDPGASEGMASTAF